MAIFTAVLPQSDDYVSSTHQPWHGIELKVRDARCLLPSGPFDGPGRRIDTDTDAQLALHIDRDCDMDDDVIARTTCINFGPVSSDLHRALWFLTRQVGAGGDCHSATRSRDEH